MPSVVPPTSSRLLHAFAVATAVAIVPLMLVGAGVTSKGAGMAFPDWPTSNGALLNPTGWLSEEHKLWEHGHRLVGWVVGMLAIGMAATSWRRGGWVRAAGLATLLAIIVQGVLGGLRVREISTELAMVHGIFGQLCFCLACIAALITSKPWAASMLSRMTMPAAVAFRRTAALTALCVLIQLVLGAALRHFGYGWALAAHLIWAAVTILMLGVLTFWILEHYEGVPMLAWLGRALVLLIGVQIFLGGGALLVTVMGQNWPKFIDWSVPSAHVVVGAILLACTVVITLCGYKVLRPAAQIAAGPQMATLN